MLYNELAQRETMRQYGQGFTNLVNSLKSSIKRQNEILDTLSMEELLSLGNGNLEEDLKQFNNQVDVEAIMSRVSIICKDKFTVNSGMGNGYTVLNKPQLESKSIITGEATNINLSFIDEYLGQINDLNLRKSLCTVKYCIIYVAGTTVENALIDQYYHTESSIYLTSYLEASLKQIPLSYIDDSKKEFANMVFDVKQWTPYKMLLQVNPKDITQYSAHNINLLQNCIILRSALLFLNEKDFLEMLNKLGVSQDNPWYAVFLNDRGRHKTVSLGFNRTK